MPHHIRLREPWTCESAEEGGVRWSRVFHRPTGLAASDVVVLEIENLPDRATVRVNDRLAPNAAPALFSFEVTSLLAEPNRIEVRLPAEAAPADLDAPSAIPPFAARLTIAPAK